MAFEEEFGSEKTTLTKKNSAKIQIILKFQFLTQQDHQDQTK